MTDMTGFIEGMPKAELHVHVEGTLEPELKFNLARRNGIELPYRSVEEMRAAYLTRVHSQNVLYAEMFFDPQAHTTRGIAYDTVIRGIRRAQVDAQDKLGIRTQLIMCFLRDMSAESAMATLEQSLAYKDWIVGVGLDSDEKGNPPIKFKAVFARARAEGYRLTMHCDVDQRHFDRFDQCFGTYFKGMEELFDALHGEIPEEWLRRQAELQLSDEEKALIEAMGGFNKLMEELKKRLEEQKGRHQGGNKWIGTAGKSPFGAYGYNPEGVRIGQHESRHRSAVKVWDRREFKNFDDTVWKDNRRRHAVRLPTMDVLHKYNAEHKVIFVGDASMSPYEIAYPGGSVEHWNEEAGAVWMGRLLDAWPYAIWLNPKPENVWDYNCRRRFPGPGLGRGCGVEANPPA